MEQREVAEFHTETVRRLLCKRQPRKGCATSLPDLEEGDPRRGVQFQHYPVFVNPDGSAEVLFAVDSAAGKLFMPLPVSKAHMALDKHADFIEAVKHLMLVAATQALSIKLKDE